MTLASKLLEGYCPEGYEPIEEGLTPDEVMVRTNAICTECISCLYEAVETYYADDIIASTEVLTEGASVTGKIKEIVNKFIERIKKIWKWFTEKVKAFPRWIYGLFQKQSDAIDALIDQVDELQTHQDIHSDSNSGPLTNNNNNTGGDVYSSSQSSYSHRKVYNDMIMGPPISKIQGLIMDADMSNTRIYSTTSRALKSGSFEDINKYINEIVSDPSRAVYKVIGSRGETSENQLTYQADIASKNVLDIVLQSAHVESAGDVSKIYDDMINEINSYSSTEQLHVAIFKKDLEQIKQKLDKASKINIKQFEEMSKKVESNLKILNSDSFKSSLERAFINNSTYGRGEVVNAYNSSDKVTLWINSLSKIISTETIIVNILMSSVQGYYKVINAAYFKCSQAFIKRQSVD